MNFTKKSEEKYHAIAFFETTPNANLSDYPSFRKIYNFNTFVELTSFCIAVNTIDLISELIERSIENDINISNDFISNIKGVDRNILEYIIELKEIDCIIYYNIELDVIVDGIWSESDPTESENEISMSIYRSINEFLEDEIE